MRDDVRRHPRFRFALRVHVAMLGETISATTVGVSREGLSVRLSPPPALEEELAITLELPNGTSIDGRACTKTHQPGCLCGMQLSFTGDALHAWQSFIDEEESTGSLWRMIGRSALAPDDNMAARGLRERVNADDLRFHTVGENGEAYRVCFERHASDAPEQSDLVALPGFREQASLVRRVLRAPLELRLDDASGVLRLRVVELARGGYACVQSEPGARVGFAALAGGELVLVSRNGTPVFPHFSDDDLERIACDTFRKSLERPVFLPAPPSPRMAKNGAANGATQMPARFTEGLDAVRFAQAAAADVQVRKYGAREVFFHPSVWARVKEPSGQELMGPTLHDGNRCCVLALVGAGAPRVVRLDEESAVTLLKPPSR